MSVFAETDNPEFWRALKSGSTISLEDEQAINESMKAGKGAKGKDYQVKDILSVIEENNLAEWRFFEIESYDETLWLMAKIVGQKVSLRIYFEDEEAFDPGTRGDLVDREEYWLFMEPEDPDEFLPADLEYTRTIYWDFEEGDGELAYNQKQQGVLYGACTVEPKQPGIDKLFTTIVEYRTGSDTQNDEILILETGGVDSKGEPEDEGGYVRVMFGCEVSGSELEIMPA